MSATKLLVPVRRPMLISLRKMFEVTGSRTTLENYVGDLLETVIADFRSRSLPAEVRAVSGFHRAGKAARVDGGADFRVNLSSEDRQRVVRLYRTGDVTVNGLAERFGVSPKTVRCILRSAGLREKEDNE